MKDKLNMEKPTVMDQKNLPEMIRNLEASVSKEIIQRIKVEEIAEKDEKRKELLGQLLERVALWQKRAGEAEDFQEKYNYLVTAAYLINNFYPEAKINFEHDRAVMSGELAAAAIEFAKKHWKEMGSVSQD